MGPKKRANEKGKTRHLKISPLLSSLEILPSHGKIKYGL